MVFFICANSTTPAFLALELELPEGYTVFHKHLRSYTYTSAFVHINTMMPYYCKCRFIEAYENVRLSLKLANKCAHKTIPSRYTNRPHKQLREIQFGAFVFQLKCAAL